MLTHYETLPLIGDPQTHAIDWPPDPGFKKIDALVRPHLNGANLERVSVLYRGKPADMFVDELGANKGLPRNVKATAIYRAWTLHKCPGISPESLPAIYGPAVIFHRQIWF